MSVDVPNGYKQTKVGVIPEEWEVVRLGDILTKKIQNGYSPVCPEGDTGHWILGLGALSKEGKMNIFDRKPAPSDDHKVKQFVLEENDFLISRANTPERVGFSGVFRSKEKVYSYPDLMMRFRVSEELVSIDYMENYLKSFRVLRYLQLSAAGSSSSMVKINKNVVANIKLSLPPLKEQQKIAQILTTWDDTISKHEELIKAKETLKKGLMQKLLSGEVRFAGFNGEWEEVRLGDILYEQKKDKVLNPQNYELLTVKLHCKGISKTGKIPNITENGRPYYFVKKGELLIGRQNFHNGGFGISSFESGRYITSNAISHYKTFDYLCDVKFINYYFSQYDFYKKIDYLIGGTGQKEISKKEFENLKVKLPSLQEQQKITDMLSFADREIELLKRELEALKEQKRGLMQKLLTGEVRVRV
jgi:type I restriction enzyme S subunit